MRRRSISNEVDPESGRRRCSSQTDMHHRTSTTHPLRVDWLPLEEPGGVGLTFAPGKRGPSGTGGDWARDLGADLDRLLFDYGVDVLVSLIHEYELGAYGIPSLWDEAARRGFEVWRHPIHDGCVPRLPQDLVALVESIVEAKKLGRRVVIHCIGGLGRTGTVGGCLLTALGWHPRDARKALVSLRGERCPETPAQRHFIELFASECVGSLLSSRELGAQPPRGGEGGSRRR